MKTARLNLLMEPDDKALIEARASAAGVSVGEFVRRAATAYAARDGEPSEAEMIELVAAVKAMADRMEARLDAGLADLEAMRAEAADREAARAAARAEAEGRVWPFGR